MSGSRGIADPTKGRRAWYALVVGILALVPYLPSLANGFAGDDLVAVAPDERIRTLAEPVELLRSPYLHDVPAARSPWRPITTLSYAVSWRIGSGAPWAFHATNVLFHVAATLLVLSVFQALGARPVAALLGASVFAVHPVHVEAVANVVGRADVLMTIFCLIGIRIYVSPRLGPAAQAILVALAYALALGTKENAISLPALLALVEALRVSHRPNGRASPSGLVEPVPPLRARLVGSWPVYAGLALALVVYLVARRAVLGSVVHVDIASYILVLPPVVRITTAVANLSEVARLLVVPWDLSPDYGPAVLLPAGLGSPRFWAGLAVVLGATGLALGFVRRGRPGRWISVGIAWIGASFLIVSNLVLPIGLWLGERTLYLPSVGLCIALVGIAGAATERLPRINRAGVLAVVAVVVLGGWRSWTSSLVWRDDETLYGDLAARHPESFMAQWWLGRRLLEIGEVDRGVAWLERAADTNPNSVRIVLEYARALLLAGRAPDAEAAVRPIPVPLHPSRSVYLVESLIAQGRHPEAAEAVRRGLDHFPDDPRLVEQARVLGVLEWND